MFPFVDENERASKPTGFDTLLFNQNLMTDFGFNIVIQAEWPVHVA